MESIVNTKVERPRYEFIDILRIVACFLVIVNHTITTVFYGAEPSRGWFISVIWFYISKLSVPVFVMITGYILISALCGALTRDYTPEKDAGKLQGIRMIFSVLLPMLLGPMIGNTINKAAAIPLPDLNSADVMTTQYIPAPGIFLAGAIVATLIFALIPLLTKLTKKQTDKNED